MDWTKTYTPPKHDWAKGTNEYAGRRDGMAFRIWHVGGAYWNVNIAVLGMVIGPRWNIYTLAGAKQWCEEFDLQDWLDDELEWVEKQRDKARGEATFYTNRLQELMSLR